MHTYFSVSARSYLFQSPKQSQSYLELNNNAGCGRPVGGVHRRFMTEHCLLQPTRCGLYELLERAPAAEFSGFDVLWGSLSLIAVDSALDKSVVDRFEFRAMVLLFFERDEWTLVGSSRQTVGNFSK